MEPLTIQVTSVAPRIDIPIALPTKAKRGKPIETSVLANFDLGSIVGDGSSSQQHVLIIGGASAGKTTVLKAAAGLAAVGKGKKVSVTGGPLPSPGEAHFISSTDTHEASLSVRETIDYALTLTGLSGPRFTSGQLLRDAKLDGVAHQRCGKLTAAEARRLTLLEGLLAALGKPGVKRVCIDEMTAHMSPSAAVRAAALITSLGTAAGISIIAVAHSPQPAVLACFHRVVLLSEGHTLYSGPPAGLAPYLHSTLKVCPPQRYSITTGSLAQLLCDDPVGTAVLYGSSNSGGKQEGLLDAFSPSSLGARWSEWQSSGSAAAAAAAEVSSSAAVASAEAEKAAIAAAVDGTQYMTPADIVHGPRPGALGTFGAILKRHAVHSVRTPLYWVPGVLLGAFVGCE